MTKQKKRLILLLPFCILTLSNLILLLTFLNLLNIFYFHTLNLALEPLLYLIPIDFNFILDSPSFIYLMDPIGNDININLPTNLPTNIPNNMTPELTRVLNNEDTFNQIEYEAFMDTVENCPKELCHDIASSISCLCSKCVIG